VRFSIYNALPQTTTFVAVSDKTVVATATLVPDSSLGLPMDEIYHPELEAFRMNNKKLCEISMLASDTDLFRGGVSMMLNAKKLFFVFYLFKIILDYARDYLKLDYICITINPKHKLTYDFLLFKDMGILKSYDHANGAPAIAKYLDLVSAEEKCKKINEGLYKMFFVKKTAADKLSGRFVFGPQDLKYFFVEKSDIFKSLPPAQLEYLKNCYPSFNFSQLIP